MNLYPINQQLAILLVLHELNHFSLCKKRMTFQPQKCTNNQSNLAHLLLLRKLGLSITSFLIFKSNLSYSLEMSHQKMVQISPASHIFCKSMKNMFFVYYFLMSCEMVMIYSQIIHKSCFLLKYALFERHQYI